MGSREGLSAIDTFMASITQTQDWPHTNGKPNKRSKGPDSIRPTLMANDVKGAFNCVLQYKLTEIMTHFCMLKGLVSIIRDSTTDHTISMRLDSQSEELAPFKAGLPQGSPLSPTLLILYGSASTSPNHEESMETAYVDDEIMLQGARSCDQATTLLQGCLNSKVEIGARLNIRFPPDKVELMHLVATTN